jgi:gliding motility-associated-like protein
VPNAFSPNDNGQNDQFGPVGVGIKAINFYVYDRWGKMVWESHSMDERWDGKVDDEIPNQSNVFIWKAEVTFVNGLTEYYTGEVLMVK